MQTDYEFVQSVIIVGPIIGSVYFEQDADISTGQLAYHHKYQGMSI